MDGAEFPQKDGWSRRRVVFAVFAATFVLVAAFFLGRFSSGRIENFFGGTFALVSDTLHDVLGFGGQGKLAAEIDLNNGPAVQQNINNQQPTSAVSSPTAHDDALSTQNKNSAEGSTGNFSKDLNMNRIGSQSKTQIPDPAIPTSAKIAAAVALPIECNFSNGAGSTSPVPSVVEGLTAGNPTHAVLLNEIAWMGSPMRAGESASQASNNEWVELKNISAYSMDFSGWQILNQSGKFKIVFDAGEKISAGKFYLLERIDDNAVLGIKADKIYSGALSNFGDWLRLFDSSCSLVDEINASAGSTNSTSSGQATLATGGWPGGDNVTKQTLERNAGDFGWHTSASPGGTPKAENSTSVATVRPSSPQDASVQSPQVNSDLRSLVVVAIQGDGSGSVTSSPAGINCGLDCSGEYPIGTALTLSATPSTDSLFDGWSGACMGKGTCSLTATTAVISATATFKLISLVGSTEPPPPASAPPPALSPEPSPTSTTTTANVNHLVIAAVQIAGASTTNDFIKIFNPTGASVDIGGWRLRKRTKPGTEYSVRAVPQGSIVQAGGYFIWANSTGGFSETIGADTSSTETLAADNSIALLNSTDITPVDALAWGSGHTNPYAEGLAYPTNPAANQILKRQFVGGAIQDTDNNSADFAL